jgi:manganese/iron transport system permease protein
VHLDHILFGDILGIGWGDVIETGLIAMLVTAAAVIRGRDLLLFVFDPQQAGALGLNTRILHYGLLAILSLTIVAALKAVGIILAIALLVAPGAVAFLLTRRFEMMVVAAIAVATLSSLLGVYLSFFIDSAPAPTIVLLMTIAFILAFLFSPNRSGMGLELPQRAPPEVGFEANVSARRWRVATSPAPPRPSPRSCSAAVRAAGCKARRR